MEQYQQEKNDIKRDISGFKVQDVVITADDIEEGKYVIDVDEVFKEKRPYRFMFRNTAGANVNIVMRNASTQIRAITKTCLLSAATVTLTRSLFTAEADTTFYPNLANDAELYVEVLPLDVHAE